MLEPFANALLEKSFVSVSSHKNVVIVPTLQSLGKETIKIATSRIK